MATLHWSDYLILSASILLTVVIGIIAAWKRRKDVSMEDYFLGNRSMNPWAVGLSLFASLVSGGTLLASPVEIYLFGAQFAFSVFGLLLSTVICGIFYLPIFYRLSLTSAYKYMELRYQSHFLRLISSTLFLLQAMLQCGLILYVPAVALSQITDLEVYACVLISGSVCLFYTVAGGMRAVVWVDTVQTVILFGGLIAFIIIGANRVGSSTIVQRSKDGGRFDVWIVDLDPRTRYTLWSVTIGHAISGLPNACANQVLLQRYFSVGNLSKARRSLVVGNLLGIPIFMLPAAVGLTMYAFYYYCDPIVTGRVARPEQLLPKYMIDIAGHIPGVSGIFMSAVFAACLSSLSSYINSLAAVCIEDFVKPLFLFLKRRKLPENSEKKWSITFSFMFAILAMGSSFLPKVLGTLIIQLNRIFIVAFLGPILTVFTLGMFVPWSNIWGAYMGMISSMALALWMSIGSVFYGKTSAPLPLGFSNCSFAWPPANFTMPTPKDDVPLQALYDVSYQWLGPISFIFGVIMGMLVSFITSGCRMRNQNVDPDLVYDYSCCSSQSSTFGTSDTKEEVHIYRIDSHNGVSDVSYTQKAE